MHWFKHDADANMDARLQDILLDYGLEGYGLYWYCLELITNKLTSENITFQLEHDARIIARNTGSTPQKITEMMTRFIELGLFEQVDDKVTCLKLAKRLDKSMTNSPKMRDFIESVRERHDIVSKSHERIEEDKKKKRTEEDKNIKDCFDRFWSAGMTKQAKKKSEQAFTKQFKEASSKTKDLTPESFTDYLINDIQKRLAANVFGFDKMHPTTYLNQQRWHDDIVQPQQANNNKLTQTIGALQNIELEQNKGLLTNGQPKQI